MTPSKFTLCLYFSQKIYFPAGPDIQAQPAARDSTSCCWINYTNCFSKVCLSSQLFTSRTLYIKERRKETKKKKKQKKKQEKRSKKRKKIERRKETRKENKERNKQTNKQTKKKTKKQRKKEIYQVFQKPLCLHRLWLCLDFFSASARPGANFRRSTEFSKLESWLHQTQDPDEHASVRPIAQWQSNPGNKKNA